MPVDFPVSDFDEWAAHYDASVEIDRYPFLGYRAALETLVTLAQTEPGQRVLDLGTGTGNLAVLFARVGCQLVCTDFSDAMLAQARRKLPEAQFWLHDLRAPIPADLRGPFDRIVSAYVFHHFSLDEKTAILKRLLPLLASDGSILIADIAFPDEAALNKMKLAAGDEWEDEPYWLADEALPALRTAGLDGDFRPISACAGIFHMHPEGGHPGK